MTGTRRWTSALLATSLLAALAGCSLPLPHGVHEVGEVAGAAAPDAALQVIPPGPTAGATPTQTVLGFLGAQASSEDRYAVARSFLTPHRAAAWRDAAEVQVYDPARVQLRPRAVGGGAAVVEVSLRVSAQVGGDGAFSTRDDALVAEDYRLLRVGGEWRLDGVPDGLRLTAADLERSFVPRDVYYLAPAGGEAGHRLVPDQVFLPAAADPAATLIDRLLRPPSQALAGSVTTAVPPGTRVQRVVVSTTGTVTVSLAPGIAVPSGQEAQDLSAQVVWTLRSLGSAFRGLRLLVGGATLPVPGQGDVQDAGAWDAYDPEGLAPPVPYYFTVGRRLRASVELPTNPATAGEIGDGRAVPVDAVAVTPDRTRVALLEQARNETLVRIGPLRGQSFPVVARGARLASPTWGAGTQGLWLVRGSRDLVRVGTGGITSVTVLGLGAGGVQAVALSRDGVRVALVVGGRLLVGRVEQVADGPRVVDPTQVSWALQAVTGVAWASSTELVVLGATGPRAARQVVRVAVDGSSLHVLSAAGTRATALTASPAGVVIAAARHLQAGPGDVLRPVGPLGAGSPAYPG